MAGSGMLQSSPVSSLRTAVTHFYLFSLSSPRLFTHLFLCNHEGVKRKPFFIDGITALGCYDLSLLDEDGICMRFVGSYFFQSLGVPYVWD